MTSTVKFDRWFNTNDELVADGTSGFPNGRNLLYNGAMQVAQRGTSEAGITSSGYYTADRWGIAATFGTYTQTIETDGPTGSGFTKSLKIECTTSGTPASSDLLIFRQRFEGQDLQGIKKGTSEAESLTLSFWVKSDTTGTYIVELFDPDNTRQVSAAYTVSATDTWEKKTITFDGDTTGTLSNDNSYSFSLQFWLAAGTDFTSGTLNTSWAANTNANRVVGQTNLAAATSNYWQVTGVQLETGTAASSFEHKSYGVELAECQRYCQVYEETNRGALAAGFASLTNRFPASFTFPEMRTNPSGSISASADFEVIHEATVTVFSSGPSIGEPTRTSARLQGDTVSASLTVGNGGIIRFVSGSGGRITLDAEL